MSTQYDGIPSNVSIPAPVPIASSTATLPISISTTIPHGLTTGDLVDNIGHTVNIFANGTWPVTVTGATTFTIPALGLSPGGATGIVVPLTFGATYQIPSDGDLADGAHLNVAPEALGDRTAFLLTCTGEYKLANVASANLNAADPSVPWGSISSGTTAWTVGPSVVNVTGVQVHDLLETTCTFSAAVTVTGGTQAGYSLGYVLYAPGAAVPTPVKLPGSGQFADLGAPTSGYTLTGLQTAATFGTYGVYIGQQMVTPATLMNTGLWGDFQVTVKVWRKTGVNQ